MGRSSRRAWTSETVALSRSQRMSMRRYSASVRVGVGRLAIPPHTTPTPDSPRGLGSRLREPGVDAAFEDVERQRARSEDDLMEVTQVEPAAQLRARAVAQFEDLQLADLVRGRLTGISDVAVDLIHHVELRLRCVVEEVRDRAVARPPA